MNTSIHLRHNSLVLSWRIFRFLRISVLSQCPPAKKPVCLPRKEHSCTVEHDILRGKSAARARATLVIDNIRLGLSPWTDLPSDLTEPSPS